MDESEGKCATVVLFAVATDCLTQNFQQHMVRLWRPHGPVSDQGSAGRDAAMMSKTAHGVVSCRSRGTQRNQRHTHWEPWDSHYRKSHGSLEVNHGDKVTL